MIIRIGDQEFILGETLSAHSQDRRAQRLSGRSKVAAMMAARRARKRKMLTPEAEGVHRAISAMQKPGRAHEL